ncbi:hypothetical protein PG993_013593 [Apiospora rasikravindrae]|uniref:Uncharacterized protein n=1 Tax=Apiospora rasikravindrae TaxID=990691 RepID=A0ABR1RY24_9PEZI
MTSAFKEDVHSGPSAPPSVHGARGAADATTKGEQQPPQQPGTSFLNGPGRDDESTDDHVQDKVPPAAVLTKKQKFKRHCGRFKWWYVAGNIIFLAIFLPILFLVILPAIVQRIVDDQSLPIKGGAFLCLSPTQMMISLETSLKTPLAARIDPLTMFLYNKETPEFSPFLNLTLPEQKLDGETAIVVTNRTVTITDEKELITWFDSVWDKPKTELSVRGDSTVHLGALHSKVHLEKTVEVNSLNQLSGFGIQDLSLVLPPLEDGRNVRGTLNLPNWGSLTLGLGNVSLNLMAGDIRIGLITIYDVMIPPGNNTREFDGRLYLDQVAANLGAVLASQGEALNQGMIRIDATGNATIVNGKHIHFVETILNKKRVTSKIGVFTLLGDVIDSLTNSQQGAAGNGTTNSGSLVDLVGDTFGNSTLLSQALQHWKNATAQQQQMPGGGGGVEGRSTATPWWTRGPSSLHLLRLGMKMRMGKL